MIDILKEFQTIITTLENKEIPYALCGGLAVGIYAEVRATKDIDLLLLAEDVERVKLHWSRVGISFSQLRWFSQTPGLNFTNLQR